MTNQWLRLWHDMPTDPKWRTIARKSGQRVGDVMAVYMFLLVNASQYVTERGRTHNFVTEDVATALDLSEADVEAILSAMQGKVLDGDRLTGWQKRQPKREDSSAERTRRWRERTVTQRDAPDTETDSEIANSPDGELSAACAAPPSRVNGHEPLETYRPPDGDWSKALFGPGLAWLVAALAKPPDKCRAFLGKCLKAAGQDHRAVFGLLAECQAKGIADPPGYLTAALKPRFDVNEAVRQTLEDMRGGVH